VVLAYDAILEKGVPGEVYNVCSGRGHSIQDIVDCLSRLTQIPVDIEQKVDLLRPIDNPILIGSYEKLHHETGWKPSYSIKQSLEKIYNYWYDRLS